MPRLMRGMARTAVVVGTATHVSNNVSRRQSRKYAEQDQAAAAAPAPAAPTQDDMIADLEKLGELKDKGILTQAEFDAKKKQILGL